MCVIQSMPFLHTTDSISDKKTSKLEKEDGLKKVINLYHTKQISVNTINTGNKFKCVRNNIPPVTLNAVSAEEHVGEVEWSIRTIKEVTRCDVQRLQYTYHPLAMARVCVMKRVKDRNQSPPNNGISNELSPNTLVTGRPSPDFEQVVKLNFGDYVHAYNGKKNEYKQVEVGRSCSVISIR